MSKFLVAYGAAGYIRKLSKLLVAYGREGEGRVPSALCIPPADTINVMMIFITHLLHIINISTPFREILILIKKLVRKRGHSENQTWDLSHPKRESYH